MTGTINANETLNGGVEAIPTLSGTLSGNTTSSYNSLSDKPIINGTTLEGGVDRSLVEDVKVNGVSVVNEEYIAEIENSAEDVPYDNTSSQGVQATNVQDALDEAFQRTMDMSTGFTDILAEYYNYIKHYTVGDYVFHHPSIGVIKLYRCIENTSGAWDSTKWEEVKLSNEVSDEITLREELESATKVYGTPKNLPQPIATFSDGSNLPMPSLKVGIEPIQSGSGDPSPTNIRPISGWTEANVRVVGDNWGDCADIPEPLTANKWETVNLPYNTYTISFDVVNAVRTALGDTLVFAPYNGTTNTNILASKIYSVEDGSTYQSKGTNISGRFYFTYTGKFKSLGYFWRSNSYQGLTSGSLENIMIEVGNNPTKQFKPYNGQTYNIPFTDSQGNPIVVFGGECDVVNGGGSAYKEYDSYNGETLIGPWISDRDVYAPNTSPTIGAQVVDMGDTSTFTSQPTSIKSLLGSNNVWGDCGQIKDLKYTRNLNITINDILSRLDALEG